MAGLTPLGALQAVDDHTAAYLVRKPLSRTQREVDERVGVVVEPKVADAIAKDSTIIQAAENAVNNVIDINGLSTAHLGIDDDGTPFYDPGNRTFRMGLDTDGVPFFMIYKE